MAETQLVKTEMNTELARPSILLPGYDELEDKRIIRELQGIFKGFDFSYENKYADKFEDIEALEQFAAESIKEIDRFDNDAKRSAIANSGAISAKRWLFGYIINQCLSSAAYGSKAAEKLAEAANISIAYLYQYRTVGANLTLKDAYILGMYGAGWDDVREVATIKSADDRNSLIRFFVAANNDYNNAVARETARAAFKTAISRIKTGSIPIDCSDPAQLQTAVEFAEDAPEYDRCFKALTKLNKQMSAILKDKTNEELNASIDDFFIMEDVPNAELRLQEFRGLTGSVLKNIQDLQDLLGSLQTLVESVDKSEVTKREA